MPDHEQYAASPEQQRVFVLDRLEPGSAALHVHRALLLTGPLAETGLRQALHRATARHEILRTVLRADAGRPVQQVLPAPEPDLSFEDATGTDDPHAPHVRELVEAFTARPFDLGTGPLWRVLLVRLSGDRRVLVLSMHTAVADAETLLHVLREILEPRPALDGEPGGGTPRPYREYAAGRHAPDRAAADRRTELPADRAGGEPEPSVLPVFRPRPPESTGRATSHRQVLTAARAARAELLAERLGCPLSTVLTAAFAVLLRRYGTTAEATFGRTVRTRGSDAARPLLGPRGGVAVLRLPIGEDDSFEAVVRRTDEAAYARDAETAADGTPLFRVLFDSELELPPVGSLPRPDGLAVAEYEVPAAYVHHDLRVTARRLDGGIALDWAAHAALHEPETVARAAHQLDRLLATALARPGDTVATLLSLAADEEQDALEAQWWNTTRTPYRRVAVHRLVEEQVARTPDAVAVECGETRLRYAELDRSADRLAARLSGAGAAPGDMVGLCLDRSAEQVVAVLAVLKAGCVVVPLDAAYPPERLAFMIEDAGVRVLITDDAVSDRDPVLAELFAGLTLVRPDTEPDVAATKYSTDAAESEDGPLPVAEVSAEALAYCIYTSGSTGRPKGVLVDHAALANLVAWHREAWLAEPGTRTLLYSPISFDVAFHEILAGLCTGATLVQVDEDTRRNPMALLDFVRGRRVEKWYMPFVTLQQIAQAARTAPAPTDLRELIVGGEVLRITPEIREFARRSGCVIHNHYGSTECIDVATHTLAGDPGDWPDVVPVGRATVHNMNLYILDEALRPLPVGATGEIYAEGDSLARGYHRRPELTAERFTPSPFGVQGRRLYRMGDLGRYRPDGTIECLGRADNQVKIRGFRVEPSEVEAVLAEHPAVAECVVAAKAGAQGRTRLIAYVVLRDGDADGTMPDRIRASLTDRLPDHMVPTAVLALDALPLTPSGKVDVRALPDGRADVRQARGGGSDRLSGLRESVARIWAELLELPDVDRGRNFFELGGDSVLLVQAHQRIESALGRELPAVALFRHPTVDALARFLKGSEPRPEEAPTSVRTPAPAPEPGPGPATVPGPANDDAVAVIGMACRVPGARDLTEFWANLRDGVESVRTLPETELFRLEQDGTGDPRFVPAVAAVADADRFDAAFFGYSPAEAAVIDPQQRLFLECAWEAVENAGIDPRQGRTGVYAGAALSTYLVNNVLPAKLGSRTFLSHRHFDEPTELRIEQGNASDHLATRVSYKLDLRGPGVNVQSTCSTSLVAVHLACRAIRAGDCDTALAGGVSVITPQNTGYLWRDGMMLSPDGHCRAFDARAAGTVFGNGLGVVVLKRLSAALADGDHIHAVVRGSAVNNDGAGKVDYTGPSVAAQADVIAEAHRDAGVRADEISYVEAHGTGTRLGDPIEIAGLTEAFRRSSRRDGAYCAIGSVKTNIGHLDEAAGVVGLIKTALSLQHRMLPPSLNFTEANPLAGLAESPFRVNSELRAWSSPDGVPRLAGVSSFGMGGTNCHVVLEEPPAVAAPEPSVHERGAHLLPLSARSTQALRDGVRRHLDWLSGRDDREFADMCHTAATGRRHFDRRVAVLAAGADSARAQLAGMLAAPDLGTLVSRADEGRQPQIGFLFTGQGAQYAGMGGRLYRTQPVFRAAVDECDAILRTLTGRSVVPLVDGADPDGLLADTSDAQPALFTVGYALGRLWESWGVRPDVLLGHSLGEYVAACLAGVFGPEDALRLVTARARLMGGLPREGAMAQVHAAVERVTPHLVDHGDTVSVAAVNAPDLTVLSGNADVLDSLCRELRAAGVDTVALNTSHAFHSPLMRPMLDAFRAVAEGIRYDAPKTDLVSTVTGEPVGPGEMETADYWVRQVTAPVLFAPAVRAAYRLGVRAFVELGPKPTLVGLGRACLTDPELLWLPSLTPRDPEAVLGAFRALHLAGVPVDWVGFEAPFPRRRVPLPAYAFQRERHWVGTRPAGSPEPPPAGATPAPAFELAWDRLESVAEGSTLVRRFVLVGAADGLAGRLAEKLRGHGHEARVEAVPPGGPGGPGELRVVFVPEPSFGEDPSRAAERVLTEARELLASVAEVPVVRQLWFVTRESALGTPASEGELALSGLPALARTIGREHPELDCVSVAVSAEPGAADLAAFVRLLVHGAPGGEEELAVHDGHVHRPRLRPWNGAPSAGGPGDGGGLPVRPDGVYLITGGTGALGLRVALDIARGRPRRVVLVGRTGRPPVDDPLWAELVATGTRVDRVRADVADEEAMCRVVDDCGPDLRGVVHCAGTLDDGILLRQTTERCAAVLRPKAAGAWNLHRHTQDRPLDFFVLFSSLATRIGYAGQGSYAYANGFLDALARHRARLGLPALAVSWGSWAGSGMSARLAEEHQERLRDAGETPLPPDAALAALAALTRGGPAHATVADLDSDALSAVRTDRATARRRTAGEDGRSQGPTPDAPFAARLLRTPPEAARRLLRATVTATVAEVLTGDAGGPVDPVRGFTELGMDSLGALELRGRLHGVLGTPLPATLAFDHPCLDALVRHLEERHFGAEIAAEADEPRDEHVDEGAAPLDVRGTDAEGRPDRHRPDRYLPADEAVAIIGMACRFPDANSPEEFWRLLAEGRDAVRDIPGERWDSDRLYDEDPDAPGRTYVRRAALLDDVDRFDAAFFGISPREAACMDPRHRLLLEETWSAIESAGIDPDTLRGGDTAVYLGCDEFTNDHFRQAAPRLGHEPYISTGTTLSFAAGRLSYKLGLHGPSMVVATACSSSLVALHSAVRAIRQGECGTAVVGAAKLHLAPEETVQLCRLRVLAPDGRSKAFSADADGFGRGEGGAVVLLKRLDRAVADGDPVLAVIRGTAVNHDGPSAGLTVPNGGAQARLLTRALADARLEAEDVTYVEAHGTGTPLGDPIELHALAEALGKRTEPLRIGSAKANIGHLEEAAGLAGVIKVVLALRHGVVPPQIHCDRLSSAVDWDSLPLAVERAATPWPAGAPRIAGVSSFGASGTNAHVLVEAAPGPVPGTRPAGGDARDVFPFSARDEADLAASVRQFTEALAEPGAPTDPAEVAYTLQTGRKRHRIRLAVVAPDLDALRDRLAEFLRGGAQGPDVFRGEAPAAGTAVPAAPTGAGGPAALAAAWCAGQDVDWAAAHGPGVPRRVPLPSYPFKRVRVRIVESEAPPVSSLPVLPAQPPAQAVPEPAPPMPLPHDTTHLTDVGDALRAHVAQLLGMRTQDLSDTDRFDELGADSLTFMRVSQFVRERFQVVLAFQQLFEEATTLHDLAVLVAGRSTQTPAAAPEPVTHRPAAPPAPEEPTTPAFRSGPSALGGGAGVVARPPTSETLTPRQERFLVDLVERYAARTPGSKAEAERERPFLTNCRMPPFQPLCKEIAYPIVVERSSGSRFRDIDGNDYLDISMGYGVHLFGHRPDFVTDALRGQLEDGFHIGPQARQAGQVARLLCEVTGMSRAAFCNSGTEAVMAALRFARAATGRTRFVMFEGSYHGWSDQTLALPAGTRNSLPMARGIGVGPMDDVVVLEYGTAESLATIRELAGDLAAVLVEPVQSRRPDLRPVDFLRELREITAGAGTALIFDEVITGFRVHPGGAQAWSGVSADLVTYGKILGGGMPIGAVAGRAAFMDTVDGGQWNFGDDSRPTTPTTFFGGTFNKNPLTMAAAHAVLTRVREEGPELQSALAENVTRLAEDFNAFCRREGFPLRIVHFSSMFRFIGEGEYSLQRFPLAIDLFFHLLALKGIYVLETRVCFLSTAHAPDDVRLIAETAKDCLTELRAGGFFPPPPAPAAPAPVPVAGASRTASRLVDDVRLGADFTVPRDTVTGPPRDVLLTGATGFLGGYLALDLLRHTSARVHCLVRADDAQHARQRVLERLAELGGVDEAERARVVGVPGDLAAPGLGLDDATRRALAERIDAVHHNGAQVNSLLPYDRLRPVNVEATRELLRLAATGLAKPFHYVSTDAVFDAYGYLRQATIYEDEPLTHGDSQFGGGYAETKWVAEKLVEQARAAGLPASVYRPGAITGAVAGGCGQPGDFLNRFIRGIVRMGVCPEMDATVDAAPADYVSRMIVELSRSEPAGGTYHLTHPDPLPYDAFVGVLRGAGFPLDVVPLHRWEALLGEVRYEDDNPLYPLLPLFTESTDPVFRRARLDVRRARAGAPAVTASCPSLRELLPRYLERFAAEGLLPRASGRPRGTEG
ncbi:amino acid adenylation domain-containing protein [Streptomyces sp. NPDC048629]|uniref:non-ribosomal peptide synthetase/type I polyketide synthase n=1 Tax=Streptomyces sp. NPDC048629 TaxID=3154824 RepID=UPI003448539E